MKRFLQLKQWLSISLLLITISSGRVFGQLQIDSTMTPAQLVQTVLLGGGITVSNVTYTGFPNSISSFTANGANLGLQSGVMLTTGYAGVAYGPNDASNAGSDVGAPSFPSPAADSDALLDAIIQQTTAGVYSNDAAVLEFDFVPTADTVKFRYVFGSEEYPEFVGSINDVFAFFLTGPGGYNNSNIALIPGTTTPILIGNVNSGMNSQYYVDNTNGTSIQYDGFTTVMTAVAAVQCGQTYHIKIAIGDASDGVWDSAVFLEAGSFSSVGAIQIIPDVSYSSTNDTVMYEGCGDATIQFVRTGNLGNAQVINYTIGGTATNGVDYNNLSGQLTIAAGDTSAFITINPVADGLPEGTETIILSVTNTVCSSSSVSSVTINIVDVLPLAVNAGPDQSTACTGGGNVTLTANVTNGVQPYAYDWQPTGDITQSISVLPASTTTYTITVTDLCGNTATDNVDVLVQALTPITLTMSPDVTICQGETTLIEANVQGGNGTIILNWNNGIQSATQQVTPATTTTYTVTVSDACNSTLTDDVTVTVVPIQADFGYLFVTNTMAQFDNMSNGYVEPVWWDFGDGTTSAELNPSHEYTEPGAYTVKLAVTNLQGCVDTIEYSLIVKSDFYFYIPTAFTPNNDGVNEIFNGKGVGFDEFYMGIYNRWGENVFSTVDLGVGWDGKDKNGNIVPTETYTYVVKIKVKANTDEIVYRGILSVIR